MNINFDDLKNKIVKNLKFYHDFFNSARENAIKSPIKRKRVNSDKSTYALEKSGSGAFLKGYIMYGTDRDRESNDSFEIASHPMDSDYKFMVVAEGNGFVPGESASKMIPSAQYVVSRLKSCFDSLDAETLRNFNIERINDRFNSCLTNVDRNLKRAKGDNEAKMIMAVIGPEYTFVANVGNLRCYIGDGLNISQLNEEDSDIWKEYRMGYFAKDEMRFTKSRDFNVCKLGDTKSDRKYMTTIYVISSDDFDRMYLFSRGVVNCVSEDRMVVINSTMPEEEIVEEIIKTATDGKREKLAVFPGEESSLFEEVKHGKKDATACMLVKKK